MAENGNDVNVPEVKTEDVKPDIAEVKPEVSGLALV